MAAPNAVLPPPIETIGELRELYRAAESRAARMRFLSRSARDLAEANADTLDAVLRMCGDRLAFFLGRTDAELHWDGDAAAGLPVAAPGAEERAFGTVVIAGVLTLDDVADAEDREAVRLQLELMGLTVDRIERERERARMTVVLREREQRLEYVVGRLFSAQEEERRRVSHELHDGVAQTATALVRMIEGSGGAEAGVLADIARGLVQELRGVIGNLRPPLLDDLGLDAAIRALVDELLADGFAVDLTIGLDGARWSPTVETAFFRVAQEAISNIRKHAGGPCRVEMALTKGRGASPHRLVVRDFGRGCERHAEDGRVAERGVEVGIDVMRERITALGGALRWKAEPGRGVTVTALVPAEAR